jgi:hypothetical protein
MSRPTLAWMDVLDQIERSLEQSLRQAAEPPGPPSPGTADGPGALGRLDERLARWQARIALAEASATEADGALAAEQAALEDWRQRAAAVREKLGAWPSRAG